jgi:hypothetical protein
MHPSIAVCRTARSIAPAFSGSHALELSNGGLDDWPREGNPIFEHDELYVDRRSVDCIAWSFQIATKLNGIHHPTHDQRLRAVQSVSFYDSKGNGKRARKTAIDFLILLVTRSWNVLRCKIFSRQQMNVMPHRITI